LGEKAGLEKGHAMSEKKFKIGDRVRYVGNGTKKLHGEVGVINRIPGPTVNLADVIFDNGRSFLNIQFASLEKIKDKKNPHRKTIKIVVRREGDGYRVKEVDALEENDLPDEYLDSDEVPWVAKKGETILHVNTGGSCIYVCAGRKLTKDQADRIRIACKQAGKRLHEINKRKREAEKTETWEW
jgi:hypothetical protein